MEVQNVLKKLISIVAPMYNEEDTVDVFCSAVLGVMADANDTYRAEILLVNDGSTDGTYVKMLSAQEANPEEVTIVDLSRNFGLEGAIYAGLKSARGDAVIVMDADLQDPPNVILKLLGEWEKGFDIVAARRISRKYDSWLKRFTASCFYRLLGSMSERLTMEYNAANYRLLNRKALDALLSLKEVNFVFRVLAPFVGMKTSSIEYERDERYAGKTKYNLKSSFLYSLDGIAGFSIAPLRKVFLAVPISVVLAALCLLGFFLSSQEYKGYFLVSIVISVFFVIVFLCMSVMAEYLAQTFKEVKRRPVSVIYDYKPCGNAAQNRGTSK
jgi:dolichol-phosphate mannosyltransferase